MIETTFVIPYFEKYIVLGMKRKNFGVGKWNGFGGKIEIHETPIIAAAREFREETEIDVTPGQLNFVGYLNFYFIGKHEQDHEVWVYLLKGSKIWEFKPTEEMEPKIFDLREIPYKMMWPDDYYWLPNILEGYNVIGTFVFNEKERIESMKMRIEGRDCIQTLEKIRIRREKRSMVNTE